MSYDPFYVYQNSNSEEWTGPYRLKGIPVEMTAKILQKVQFMEKGHNWKFYSLQVEGFNVNYRFGI